MPPDYSRRSNPQGRQKSCLECAKAKRRCNLQHPRCTRCSRQNLACAYPPQPGLAATPRTQSETTTPEEIFGLRDSGDIFGLDAEPPDVSVPGGELIDFDFSVGEGSAQAFNDLPYDGGNGGEDAGFTDVSYVPDRSFSASHITPFVRSRIEYSMEQLQLAPKMMVERNATPWIHPRIYEEYMPKSMQGRHHGDFSSLV